MLKAHPSNVPFFIASSLIIPNYRPFSCEFLGSGFWRGACQRSPLRRRFDDLEQEHMGVSKKIVVPQNGWFIMEHPIKMDDLRVPLFLETSISI